MHHISCLIMTSACIPCLLQNSTYLQVTLLALPFDDASGNNKGCVEYRRSIRYGDGARLKIRFYANLKVDIRFHLAWIHVTQEAYLVQCITCIAATTHPQQIANIGTTSNRNFLNRNQEVVIISDHFQRQKNMILVFPPLKKI